MTLAEAKREIRNCRRRLNQASNEARRLGWPDYADLVVEECMEQLSAAHSRVNGIESSRVNIPAGLLHLKESLARRAKSRKVSRLDF